MANPFLAFCLRLLGVTPDHWEMIDQKPGGRRALNQLFSALAASIAFGCSVYRFSVTFMKWAPAAALILGVAIGLMLLIFDLHMFDQLRTTLDDSRRAVVLRYARRVRVLVFAISGLSAIVLAVDHFSDSIASHQKQEAKTLQTSLAQERRYASRLEQANSEKKSALEQLSQMQKIENDLFSKQQLVIENSRQLKDELKGAEAPNGTKFVRGDGPKAKGLRSYLQALDDEIRALEGRKTALGNPTTVIQNAEQAIATVYQEINAEIAVYQGGSTKLMEAFIALVFQSPVSTLLPFMFLLLVLLLADGLLLAAYASAMSLCTNERATAAALDRDWAAQIQTKNAEMRQRWSNKFDEIHIRYSSSPTRPTATVTAGSFENRGTGHATAQSTAQADAETYREAA